MVEQWSSKPFAWVRFLLSLVITLKSSVNSLKNINLLHLKPLKTFDSYLRKVSYETPPGNLKSFSIRSGFERLFNLNYVNTWKTRKNVLPFKRIRCYYNITNSKELRYVKNLNRSPSNGVHRILTNSLKWKSFWKSRSKSNFINSSFQKNPLNLLKSVDSTTIFLKTFYSHHGNPNLFWSSKEYLIAAMFKVSYLLSNQANSSNLYKYFKYYNLISSAEKLWKSPNTTSLKISQIKQQSFMFDCSITRNKSLNAVGLFNYKRSGSLLSNNSLKLLFKNTILFNKSNLSPFLSILTHFLTEEGSIQSSNKKLRKFQYVLSKIPFYKMDPFSPVTADKHRGNIYRKLSLINFTKNSVQVHPKSSLTYNTSLYQPLVSMYKYSTYKTKSLWVDLFDYNIHYLRSYYIGLKKKESNIYSALYTKLLVKRIKSRKSSTLGFVQSSLNNSLFRFKWKTGIKKHTFMDKRIFRKYLFLKKMVKLKRYRLKNKLLKRVKIITTSRLNIIYSYKKRLKHYTEWIVNSLHWKSHKKKKIFLALKRFKKKRRNYIQNLIQPNGYKLHKPLPFSNVYKRSGVSINYSQLIKQSNSLSFFALNNKNLFVLTVPLLFTLFHNKFWLKSVAAASQIQHVHSTTTHTICFWIQTKLFLPKHIYTNLLPNHSFKKIANKKVLNSFTNKNFEENLSSWYYHTFIRFIEHCTGKKTLFQFYPFLSKSIGFEDTLRYKKWLPRMVFYERKLGHRFFLEEALHLIHLSFSLKDPKVVTSWLKAMILRISFWKTRSIFRFIKYLFHNYFRYVFNELGVKGLKIKLKGKISAAGNSRKRTILYRVGKTSHSETNLRVVAEATTIHTFTGVMGLGVWIFY